jgi:hypothetical protein
MKFKVRILFNLFLLIVFSYALYEATAKMARGAEIFPLMMAIPGLILVSIQLFLEIHDRIRGKERKSGGFVDLSLDTGTSDRDTLLISGRMLLWILSFYIAIWIVGFKIAVVAFFVLYLKWEARSRWLNIIILTGLACYGIFFHFEKVMSIHWPDSLVGRWVDIPWLFG